jgi:hypothetical protein
MSYVGWPTNVNKIILDSCKSVVGKGAAVSDTLDTGGRKKSRRTCANPPDEFTVEMTFDWNTKDSDGYTEKDRFLNWYKYTLCYSQNSFYFPSILLNSNNSTGADTEEIAYGKSSSYEYYRITSEPEFTKSGLSVKCSMTWQTEATGLIQIPTTEPSVDHLVYSNGCIEVVFTADPSSEPVPNDFSLTVGGTTTTISALTYSNLEADLYFKDITVAGTYAVVVAYKSTTYSGSIVVS